MRKQKAKIYKGKRVVMGDKNLVTKNEIHVNDIPRNEGHIDGELEDITNTPPKYPRCFIWYKAENFDTIFGYHSGSGAYIGESGGAYLDNMGIIKFNDDGVDENGKICDLDTFLNWNKGKYKEISFKEFMGECPEGDYGFIDIYVNKFPDPDVSNIRTLVNNNTKKRLIYLSKNLNKANLIRLYLLEGDKKYVPVAINSPYYTIDKENNCIIFEIENAPAADSVTQIKVSLGAEVVEQ